MVSLDLRTMLPVIRKAFDAGELQMQTRPGGLRCYYNGPCAIGVCLDEDTRVSLDELVASGIAFLFDHKYLTCPPEQREDWMELQFKHDEGHIRVFETLLSRLEAKYARPEN